MIELRKRGNYMGDRFDEQKEGGESEPENVTFIAKAIVYASWIVCLFKTMQFRVLYNANCCLLR